MALRLGIWLLPRTKKKPQTPFQDLRPISVFLRFAYIRGSLARSRFTVAAIP